MENGLTANQRAMGSRLGQMDADMKVSGSRGNPLERASKLTKTGQLSEEIGKGAFSLSWEMLKKAKMLICKKPQN